MPVPDWTGYLLMAGASHVGGRFSRPSSFVNFAFHFASFRRAFFDCDQAQSSPGSLGISILYKPENRLPFIFNRKMDFEHFIRHYDYVLVQGLTAR
jgi:hypothetical protein